jgi:hypothetical protein
MTRSLALAAALLLLPAAARGAESREKAKPSWGLRLGVATVPWSASSKTLTPAGGGGYVLFDIPGLLADVSADVFVGESQARYVAGGLGAYLPFGDGETLPYVGGGFKLGWTQFGGEGTWGIIPTLSAGALIGRSWSPSVRAQVDWFWTSGTEEKDPASSSHHASGFIFTLGLGF